MAALEYSGLAGGIGPGTGGDVKIGSKYCPLDDFSPEVVQGEVGGGNLGVHYEEISPLQYFYSAIRYSSRALRRHILPSHSSLQTSANKCQYLPQTPLFYWIPAFTL
jgi:hypothetical protein